LQSIDKNLLLFFEFEVKSKNIPNHLNKKKTQPKIYYKSNNNHNYYQKKLKIP